MRIVRLTPIQYDLLQQLAAAFEMTEKEALTHLIVQAFTKQKIEENKENN